MDHTANTARAALKAMREVVVPALDGDGRKQAAEQAQLVADFLAFVAERVDLIDRRAAFHLRCTTATARALAADPAVPGLRSRPRLEQALRQRPDPTAAGGSIEAVTAGLNAAIGAVVRDADGLPAVERRRIEQIVVAGAQPGIRGDRSWLAPLGFDPDPLGVPELGASLDWGLGAG
ncbi:hypothetical protein GIS00_00810 [Nakamurella sp. YIM 132087]|uniref:Uncharacterized protein n=1 Tax=Nakamurella alba TaxID=2665158 RepID=A0A7K1FGS4_9ACTN|nr:hypothetical protein [Nakamurella alba]MTD12483.1 hypothetical protein [Nakamurella alba]